MNYKDLTISDLLAVSQIASKNIDQIEREMSVRHGLIPGNELERLNNELKTWGDRYVYSEYVLKEKLEKLKY